ncbi:MAG: DUF1150 family protein [Alphaproteobacteria bacterium]|nr:DUF1150 family protein [Alphaproteobacteria bacterium]
MDRIERIKRMSAHELAMLGVQDLAYIKRVIVDGATGYAVHAADGTQIVVVADRDVAFATVRQHDLEPVSVH